MTAWKWQLRYGMQRKKRTALAAGTVLLMGQEGVSSFLSSINFNDFVGSPALFPVSLVTRPGRPGRCLYTPWPFKRPGVFAGLPVRALSCPERGNLAGMPLMCYALPDTR